MGSIRKTFITLVVLGLFAMIAIPVANADNGDPVRAGQVTTATTGTNVTTTNGVGLGGFTTAAVSAGVEGESIGGGAGVAGFSSNGNGVWGYSRSSTASGVYGENLFGGYGVAGRSNDGTGVLADSSNGTALEVVSKVKFTNRSG